jgi:hypothetical protein
MGGLFIISLCFSSLLLDLFHQHFTYKQLLRQLIYASVGDKV